jgi:hypothetical protein
MAIRFYYNANVYVPSGTIAYNNIDIDATVIGNNFRPLSPRKLDFFHNPMFLYLLTPFE